MKIWIGVAALMVAGEACAADVATCTLGADKKTVTVTASNPYSQVMACEVSCDMAVPGGFSVVTCAKPVPVGAKDFLMCTDSAPEDHTYTRVRSVEIKCPDPAAPPAGSAAKDSPADDDDLTADALMQKLQDAQKQGQEALKRLKQK